jgi:hypothetical protein
MSVPQKQIEIPFNWREKISAKVTTTPYNLKIDDYSVIADTTSGDVDIILYDPSILDQVDQYNRYYIVNGDGTNRICVSIDGGGDFLQGTDCLTIEPQSSASVSAVYVENGALTVKAWAIKSDTSLKTEIDEQTAVPITGINTFTVGLATPSKNDADMTIDTIADTATINNNGRYRIRSDIKLVDNLPSGDTLNVWIKFYDSLGVSKGQESKQYSLAGDQTDSLFDFEIDLVSGDYIKWEVQTLTNFNGSYQLKDITISKEIKGFG